jgi:cytochrome b pre-mRNA-processing protein 3
MAFEALRQWLGRSSGRDTVRPLYAAIIDEARRPRWYLDARVEDSIDGRFDMINAVLAMVLIRMESMGAEAQAPSSLLAELFVEDMDGQLREIGFGDIVVGKHIGKMMGALGGRLGAYRMGLATGTLGDALLRNLYRGMDPGPDALAQAERGLLSLKERLDGQSLPDLLQGRLG